MISIEGMSTLAAISYLKDQINILEKEIDTLSHIKAKIPFTMSLLNDAKSKLQQELDDQENNARQICKELGLTKEVLAAKLKPYILPSDVSADDVPQSPCESKFPFDEICTIYL